jgi:gluconolactonase
MTTFDRRKLLAMAGTTAATAALARTAWAQAPAAAPAGPPAQAGGAPGGPPGAPAGPPRPPRPPYDPNAPLKVEIGKLKSLDPSFLALADDGAVVERIANVEGNAEGPCWVPENGGYLLHSDPPMNVIWKWDPKTYAHTVFKKPSGFFGADPDKVFREAGSNGIHYWKGFLIYADSGNRTIMKLNLKTMKVEVLADRFGDKRLNSPNDVTIAKDGTIFFTDPPYGLNGVANSKYVELDFHGVFRLGTDGEITVVDKAPLINGIGLSPDGRKLYTCGGRNNRAVFDVDAQNRTSNKRNFGENETGGDGMKVDAMGNLWCSGGPGLIIFNPAGKRIGTMETNLGASNCYFGTDGYLYITMGHSVGRVKVKVKGLA